MKNIKKLVAACVAAVMTMSLVVVAGAEDVEDMSEYTFEMDYVSDDEDFVLVSEQSYAYENGLECVSRIYLKSDEMDMCAARSTQGHMTVKAENTYTESGAGVSTDWVTMWVKGTFTWNSQADTATVSNVTYGVSPNSGRLFKVLSNPEPVHASNQGATFLFGKKYAYIEKKITMTNGDERVSKKTYTLWLDVDVTGDIHTKPGSADITVN